MQRWLCSRVQNGSALGWVTIAPSEIFGVANAIGSLEVAKKATLIVADGDPFETSTDIHHVFIDGYEISMSTAIPISTRISYSAV